MEEQAGGPVCQRQEETKNGRIGTIQLRTQTHC